MARVKIENLTVERALVGGEADQVVGAGIGVHLGYGHGGVHWNGGGVHWGQPSWGGHHDGGYWGGHHGYGHHGYGHH